MTDTTSSGFLARRMNDFRALAAYLGARHALRRVRRGQRATAVSLTSTYTKLGTQAQQDSIGEGLPEFVAASKAVATLAAAQALVVERQGQLKAAQDELATETQAHERIIGALEQEYAPLAATTARTAEELAAATGDLSKLDSHVQELTGRLGKLAWAGDPDATTTLEADLAVAIAACRQAEALVKSVETTTAGGPAPAANEALAKHRQALVEAQRQAQCLQTLMDARQTRQQLAQAQQQRVAADRQHSAAVSAADAARAADGAMKAELDQAKANWHQVRNLLQAKVTAAQAAASEADRAAQADQGPVEAAQCALGKAICQAGMRRPSIEVLLSGAEQTRKNLSELSSRQDQIASQAAAARCGALRAAVLTGLTVAILVAIPLGVSALIGRKRVPAGPSLPTAQPAPGKLKLSFGPASRPAGIVRHASGASVDVPDGPVLYSPEVGLSEVDTPDALNDVSLVSPVLCVESYGGVVFDRKTAVDLPDGNAGAEAAVLVWSRLGMWLPLPSAPVTLANGQPGRRVVIDREPTPWLFTVARAPQARATSAPPEEQGSAAADLFRLEQLRWVDKDALAAELARTRPRREAMQTSWESPYGGGTYLGFLSEAADDPRTFLAVALEDLWDVHDCLRTNDKALAWRHYLSALGALRQTRSKLLEAGRPWALVADRRAMMANAGEARLDWPGKLPDQTSVANVLESALAQYVPWGLDLTGQLIDQGFITEQLDLGVLPGLGEALFSDVELAAPGQATRIDGPWEASSRQMLDENMAKQNAGRRIVARIYSPRVLEPSTTQAVARGTELGARWGGALYGLYLLAAGASGGALLLLPTGFAVLETGLEWWDAGEEGVCVSVSYVASAGHHVHTVIHMAKHGESASVAGQTWNLKDALKGLGTTGKVNLVLMLADIGAKVVLLTSGDAATRHIQELARGQEGYQLGAENLIPNYFRYWRQCDVPPILVLQTTVGQLKPGAEYESAATMELRRFRMLKDSYPVVGTYVKAWQLDMGAVCRKEVHEQGLHGAYRALLADPPADLAARVAPELDPVSAPLPRSGEESKAWKEVEMYPRFFMDLQPREQVISFALPRDMLEEICRRKGLQPSQWNRIGTDDVSARLRPWEAKTDTLSDPAAWPATVAPVRESRQPADADRRYFVVRVYGPVLFVSDEPANPRFQGGQEIRVDRLLAHYAMDLQFNEGGKATPLCTFNVDFMGSRKTVFEWSPKIVAGRPAEDMPVGVRHLIIADEMELTLAATAPPKGVVELGGELVHSSVLGAYAIDQLGPNPKVTGSRAVVRLHPDGTAELTAPLTYTVRRDFPGATSGADWARQPTFIIDDCTITPAGRVPPWNVDGNCTIVRRTQKLEYVHRLPSPWETAATRPMLPPVRVTGPVRRTEYDEEFAKWDNDRVPKDTTTDNRVEWHWRLLPPNSDGVYFLEAGSGRWELKQTSPGQAVWPGGPTGPGGAR